MINEDNWFVVLIGIGSFFLAIYVSIVVYEGVHDLLFDSDYGGYKYSKAWCVAEGNARNLSCTTYDSFSSVLDNSRVNCECYENDEKVVKSFLYKKSRSST